MALRPCDLVMRDEALSIDEEAIGVLVEHGLVEVVACECADGVQRVPEAHRHELGAVAVLPAQDVVAAVAGRLASRAPAGALHVVQVCVRVLRPSPPAPRSGDHADARRDCGLRIFTPSVGQGPSRSSRGPRRGTAPSSPPSRRGTSARSLSPAARTASKITAMIGTGLIAAPTAKVRTSLIPCPMPPPLTVGGFARRTTLRPPLCPIDPRYSGSSASGAPVLRNDPRPHDRSP